LTSDMVVSDTVLAYTWHWMPPAPLAADAAPRTQAHGVQRALSSDVLKGVVATRAFPMGYKATPRRHGEGEGPVVVALRRGHGGGEQ
jgi:hypothetical protein